MVEFLISTNVPALAPSSRTAFGPQVGERTDLRVGADARTVEVGAQDRHAVADLRVDDRGHRPDRAAGADPRRAVQEARRLDDRVGADLHPRVDRRRARVDDRHAREHVAPRGSAAARTPARRARSTRSLTPSGRSQSAAACAPVWRPASCMRGSTSGRYSSPWALSVAQLGQRREQRAAVEGEDPGVDLADGQLLLGRVTRGLGLDHALDLALGVAHDAPVAARVLELGGQHRRGGAGLLVRGDQAGDRLGRRAAGRRRAGRRPCRPRRSPPRRRRPRRRSRAAAPGRRR